MSSNHARNGLTRTHTDKENKSAPVRVSPLPFYASDLHGLSRTKIISPHQSVSVRCPFYASDLHRLIFVIIRMYPITPRRGNEPSAQGNTLGDRTFKPRPERAKAIVGCKAFAPCRGDSGTPSIPRALPWAICVLAFQAVCRIHADNHYFLVRFSPCQSVALFTFFIEGNS